MSNINSWNTGEPAILSVLFPILFIMSEETTPAVDAVVPATEETCVDGVCADGTTCAPEVEETTEAPAETEATPAE
jgi:hypothetical protein